MNRHDDVKVAVLLGWRRPEAWPENSDLDPKLIPPFPMAAGQLWNYFDPPAAVTEWRDRYHWRSPTGDCWTRVPAYTADVAEDYKVLVHVRDNWDEDGQRQFTNALVETWLARSLIPAISYQPGDYSHALLAVQWPTPEEIQIRFTTNPTSARLLYGCTTDRPF